MTIHGDTISLDELLSQQKQAQFIATIESTDNPEEVKLTTFVPNVGCLYGTAIKIAKSSIESVVPIGDRHLHCGKNLIVVEIKFKEGASIPIGEFFEQQQAQAAKARHSLHQASMPTTCELAQEHHHASVCGHHIVCPFGHDAPGGRCGAHCCNRSHGESCSDSGVCPIRHDHCGCQCYSRVHGETCHMGGLYHAA